MKKIAVLAQKGGVGKTTLCLNLAIAAKLDRRKSAVIDMDPQKSSSEWAKTRSQQWPQIKATSISFLPKMLTVLNELKTHFVFIDTLPKDDDLTAMAAAKEAGIIIIPVGKSILDVRGIAPTVKIAQASRKPTFFVLNRFPYAPSRKEKVIKVLKSKYPDIPIAPVCLIERPTYDASLEHGLGVIEFKPKSHAASDMKALYRYLLKQMKECGS